MAHAFGARQGNDVYPCRGCHVGGAGAGPLGGGRGAYAAGPAASKDAQAEHEAHQEARRAGKALRCSARRARGWRAAGPSRACEARASAGRLPQRNKRELGACHGLPPASKTPRPPYRRKHVGMNVHCTTHPLTFFRPPACNNARACTHKHSTPSRPTWLSTTRPFLSQAL
jgi:hypothetical protein